MDKLNDCVGKTIDSIVQTTENTIVKTVGKDGTDSTAMVKTYTVIVFTDGDRVEICGTEAMGS